MPTPKQGESRQDFVSRCMGCDDMQKYDPDQRAAVCYSKYDEARKTMENPVMKSFNTIKKNLGSIEKAEEGQTKMIFGKPYTLSGGKWVQDQSPTSATDNAPDVVPDMERKYNPKLSLQDQLTSEEYSKYIETGDVPQEFEDFYGPKQPGAPRSRLADRRRQTPQPKPRAAGESRSQRERRARKSFADIYYNVISNINAVKKSL